MLTVFDSRCVEMASLIIFSKILNISLFGNYLEGS